MIPGRRYLGEDGGGAGRAAAGVAELRAVVHAAALRAAAHGAAGVRHQTLIPPPLGVLDLAAEAAVVRRLGVRDGLAAGAAPAASRRYRRLGPALDARQVEHLEAPLAVPGGRRLPHPLQAHQALRRAPGQRRAQPLSQVVAQLPPLLLPSLGHLGLPLPLALLAAPQAPIPVSLIPPPEPLGLPGPLPCLPWPLASIPWFFIMLP